MKTIPFVLLVVVAITAPSTSKADSDLAVTFELNDALIKNERLPGVHLRLNPLASVDAGPTDPVFEGTTGPDGRLAASLPAGDYLATYHKAGYVPIQATRITVHTSGQLITTSLTPMLESGSNRQRIVRIVLNWGSDTSQVKDVDAHMAPESGGPDQEVYYMEKRFAGAGAFSIELDVDDVDWGGPETITLTEPPPGRYLYWVHNYSGGASLGESEVVVRVFIDDRLAGEYRAPEAAQERYFRPFQAIQIGADLAASVLEFDSQAEVASAHLTKPPGDWSDPGDMDCEDCDAIGIVLFIMIAAWIGLGFARRRR
jgi:hypothetical protein